MLFFTSFFALHLTFLLFASPSYAGSSICVKGTCSGDTAPTNCQAPPQSQPPPNGRRNLEVDPGTEGVLRTDAQVFPSSKITTRGLGICYYLHGLHGQSIGMYERTQSFILPAGTYALKWILSEATEPVYFSIWTLPGNGHNFISGMVDHYGGTFVSDGVTRFMFVMYSQIRTIGNWPTAELWVQAV